MPGVEFIVAGENRQRQAGRVESFEPYRFGVTSELVGEVADHAREDNVVGERFSTDARLALCDEMFDGLDGIAVEAARRRNPALDSPNRAGALDDQQRGGVGARERPGVGTRPVQEERELPTGVRCEQIPWSEQ